MDIVPFDATSGDTDGHRNEAAANQYFLQLLQENRQVNVFIHDPRMQEALELRAERRHAFVLLGFGVPYFNTFFLNGTIMKNSLYFFLPGYSESQLRQCVCRGILIHLPF